MSPKRKKKAKRGAGPASRQKEIMERALKLKDGGSSTSVSEYSPNSVFELPGEEQFDEVMTLANNFKKYSNRKTEKRLEKLGLKESDKIIFSLSYKENISNDIFVDLACTLKDVFIGVFILDKKNKSNKRNIIKLEFRFSYVNNSIDKNLAVKFLEMSKISEPLSIFIYCLWNKNELEKFGIYFIFAYAYFNFIKNNAQVLDFEESISSKLFDQQESPATEPTPTDRDTTARSTQTSIEDTPLNLERLFARAQEIDATSVKGRPPKGSNYHPKIETRIRLPQDVIDWLKAKGPNYHSTATALLTALKEAEEDAAGLKMSEGP